MSGTNVGGARGRLWLLGAFTLGLATVVIGGTIVGAGPYSLPTTGTPPHDMWPGTASGRRAAKVKGATGKVRVVSTSAGVSKSIGHVGPGIQCVFEGDFEKLALGGVICPADGTYEVRDTADTDPDTMVGNDVLEFPELGGTVGVYYAAAPLRRLIAVRATRGSIAIRNDRAGPDVVSIDDGDWSFAIGGATTAYFLATTGPAIATWEIRSVPPGATALSGAASGANGDTDAIGVDAACPLNVTLTNPGPAVVRVTRQLAGQPETFEDVPPGGSATGTGPLVVFRWTYVDADPARTTSVTLSVAAQ